MKCSGGHLVAEVFRREGVKYIFGVVGGHIYPMIEAAEEKGIKYIGTRHEMTAAFMAEGWALTTGEFGVCTGTAGPGFTNLLTGLANSERGCIPVLCMAGKARISEYDRNELQDFNQIDMIKHMTRHARSVIEPYRIPEYVGRAIAHCTSGKPGPVYLEIPRDLMEGEYDLDKVEFQETYRVNSRPCGNPADVEKAARLLDQAQKPVIIAGGGAWWSQAQEELLAFAQKTGIPVFTRNAARGIIPDGHELCMGIAASKHPVFFNAIQKADLAFIIGTRTGYTMTRDAFPKGLQIIRVDIDGAELTDQLDITVGIKGDAKEVLKQLTAAVSKKDRSEWINEINAIRNMLVQASLPNVTSNQVPIHPMRLCFEVRQRIDENTIVVIDGGDAASWGNLMLPAPGPGQYLTLAGTSFGPLGVGIPYAMAAKLAHPDKKVILLTGDGAFGYGAMEYDTAMRYGINFTTIIMNDQCWGMILRSEAKRSPGKPLVGLELKGTRYDKVVEALGGYGEMVTEPSEIGPAIDRALASGKPSCVNVMTDVNCGFGV